MKFHFNDSKSELHERTAKHKKNVFRKYGMKRKE
jgi:hypothetical protein